MSGRRQRRRIERIEQRSAARGDDGDLDALLAAIRPHVAAIGDDLATVTDPFEAELAAGAILGLLAGLEQLDSPAAAMRLIEEIALQGDTAARALLVFIGLGPDLHLAALARHAEAALDARGVPAPAWTESLLQPARASRFIKIALRGDVLEARLLALFRRSGREHGFLIAVDYTDCGAITAVDPIPASRVPELVARIEAGRLWGDLPTDVEELDEESARLFLDGAIGATLDHWTDEAADDGDDLESDLLPGRIILLGRRLNESGLTGEALDHGAHVPADRPRRRPGAVVQLSARLNGADPPIWRRLQLPAATSLAGLHELLQAAFGWTGAHSHCFITPTAEYSADAVLACENEADVTLARVLPGRGEDLIYLYDFNAGWEHRIAVEDHFDADPDVDYPLCVGGGEPAPPEDIGGIEAWQRLRAALSDPEHPEHRQLVDEQVPEDLEPPDLEAINARLHIGVQRD